MGFHGQLPEILSALAFLAAAALIVAVVIVITQRVDRRSNRADDVASSERRAVPDEIDDVGARLRNACAPVVRSRPNETSLLIVDDVHTATTTAEPWRENPTRDVSDAVDLPFAGSYAWTQEESDELVERFRSGFVLDDLAEEFGLEPCAVVEEIARRSFGALEPVRDPQARRFGQPWTDAELRALHSAADSGLRISDIARQLGRDQLSAVFRLLEHATQRRAGRRDVVDSADTCVVGDPSDEAASAASASAVRQVALRG